MKIKIKSFAASLIIIIALAASCDDSSNSITTNRNNQTVTAGSLTINFYGGPNGVPGGVNNRYTLARSNNNNGKYIACGGDIITFDNIKCAEISDNYAVLNVWEFKNGEFIPYTGSDIITFDIFLLGQEAVESKNYKLTYDELEIINASDIYWQNNVDKIWKNQVTLPFTSGEGVCIAFPEIPPS